MSLPATAGRRLLLCVVARLALSMLSQIVLPTGATPEATVGRSGVSTSGWEEVAVVVVVVVVVVVMLLAQMQVGPARNWSSLGTTALGTRASRSPAAAAVNGLTRCKQS